GERSYGGLGIDDADAAVEAVEHVDVAGRVGIDAVRVPEHGGIERAVLEVLGQGDGDAGEGRGGAGDAIDLHDGVTARRIEHLGIVLHRADAQTERAERVLEGGDVAVGRDLAHAAGGVGGV